MSACCDACGGTKRVQCMKCEKYFDLCPKSPQVNCICPYCETYFVGFCRGQQLGLIKIVPWWYGKKVPGPGYVEVEWGENWGRAKNVVLVPKFYLDVNMHFAAQNGEPITKEKAEDYFRNYVRLKWRRQLEIVTNEEWETMRASKLWVM